MNGTKKIFVPIPSDVEKLAKTVLDAAFKVHTALGPGLLESVYETCLAYEIQNCGVHVESQVVMPVKYGDVLLESGYRLDLLVDKKVVVEIKAVEKLIPLYEAQLLTYLRLTGLRLGFLINFNVPRLKDGIQRIVI
jgi:GxxExxY protein